MAGARAENNAAGPGASAHLADMFLMLCAKDGRPPYRICAKPTLSEFPQAAMKSDFELILAFALSAEDPGLPGEPLWQPYGVVEMPHAQRNDFNPLLKPSGTLHACMLALSTDELQRRSRSPHTLA